MRALMFPDNSVFNPGSALGRPNTAESASGLRRRTPTIALFCETGQLNFGLRSNALIADDL